MFFIPDQKKFMLLTPDQKKMEQMKNAIELLGDAELLCAVSMELQQNKTELSKRLFLDQRGGFHLQTLCTKNETVFLENIISAYSIILGLSKASSSYSDGWKKLLTEQMQQTPIDSGLERLKEKAANVRKLIEILCEKCTATKSNWKLIMPKAAESTISMSKT
jgi:hypothetical protein